MSTATFSVLAIPGSLRRASLNRALAHAAAEVAPDDVKVTVFELGGLPLYCEDLDETCDAGPYPSSVAQLRKAVEDADALLLSCPEYNWGPSGVLKNAIDWLSRPAHRSPLLHKPIALMGASAGPAGTGRAQLQLRQNLLAPGAYVLQEPIAQVGGARRRFDEQLQLIDEPTRDLLERLLDALVVWARQLAPLPTSST